MIKNGIIKNTQLYIVLTISLAVFLIFSIITAVTIGSTNIAFQDVYMVILHKLFGIGSAEIYGAGMPMHDIVMLIRLPRLILAVAVGMGLSVCGVVMQAIVKNPLADPYILGVSSGASLGATLAVMLGIGVTFGNNAVGLMGCFGAFAVSILVLAISNVGGRSNSIKLLLSGMALSSVCSSLSSLIIYLAQDSNGMMTITYWLMGDLGGANWQNIAVVLPVILVCTIFFMLNSRVLNLMLLGDEVAITLGTNLNGYRNLFLCITAIMIGFVVYNAGMIGFVGLIIPHFVRMFVGTNHKKLIPISALLGAVLLVWADVLCRVILPTGVLPIGILISIIGAPCFVYLMTKKSYGFGSKEH